MPTPYDTRGKGEGRPDLSRKVASPAQSGLLKRRSGGAARCDATTVRRQRRLAPAPARVAVQPASPPPPPPVAVAAAADASPPPPPPPPSPVATAAAAPSSPPGPPTPPPPPAVRGVAAPLAQVTTRVLPSVLLPPTYLDVRAALSRNPQDEGAKRLMERVYTEENVKYMMGEVRKKEGKGRRKVKGEMKGKREEKGEGEMRNKIEGEKRKGVGKIDAERDAKRRTVDDDGTEDGEERAERGSPTVVSDEDLREQEHPQSHPVDLPERNADTENVATELAHDITMHDAESPQQSPVSEPNGCESNHYGPDKLGLEFLCRAVEYVEIGATQPSQRPQPLDQHTPTSSSSPSSSPLTPPPPPPTRCTSACKTTTYIDPTPLPERRPLSQQDPTIPGANRTAFNIHIPLPGLSMPTDKELKDETGWVKNMLKSGERDGKTSPMEWEVDAVEMGMEGMVDRGVRGAARAEARKMARERTRLKAMLEGRVLGFGFVR